MQPLSLGPAGAVLRAPGVTPRQRNRYYEPAGRASGPADQTGGVVKGVVMGQTDGRDHRRPVVLGLAGFLAATTAAWLFGASTIGAADGRSLPDFLPRLLISAPAVEPGAAARLAAQATPTESLAATPTPEPTELPPTPLPPEGTPEVPELCLPGPPSPRFFWTLYVAPRVNGGTGMWAPMGDNGGPFLKAYVKALYGGVWYGATLDPVTGTIVPDRFPAWPRPDLIQSASIGVQTTRVGNPMCLRSAQSTVPPCYAELVIPLVFLDRLTPEGPYLRNAYFWLPADQVVDDNGRPARLVARPYDTLSCDTRQPGVRLTRARPVYANFAGCSGSSRRIDTCYLAGCGDKWLHCQ